MKIIIRKYDIENTSEIPSINEPSLRPRVEETIIENAFIAIQSKEKGKIGVLFDSDGTLILDEIVVYSKDGLRLTRGYSVNGTFLSPNDDMR